MARTRLPVVSLDLAAVDADSFDISMDIEEGIATDLLMRLEMSVDDAKEQTPFIYHYTRSNRRHEASAHFYTGRKDSRARGCQLMFDLNPVSFPKGTRRLSQLLDVLLEQEVKVLAHCSAHFDYDLTKIRTLVPLPWRILDYENAPFDEIRGFRMVKLSGEDKVEFSAIINMAGQERIHTNLTFDHAGTFDQSFVNATFDRAVEIVSRLIRPISGG